MARLMSLAAISALAILAIPVVLAQSTVSAGPATNFGAVAVGTPSAVNTVIFTFSSSAPVIGAPVVVTEGVTGLDFSDAHSGSCISGNNYSNTTCTVDVIFTPQFPGGRNGAVLLEDNGGNLLATAYVYGQGTGPMANFRPGTESVVADRTTISGLAYPGGVAVDAHGNVYIPDQNGAAVWQVTPGPNLTFTIVMTVPSGGTPLGLAVDGAGNLYAADSASATIWMAPLLSAPSTFGAPIDIADSTSNIGLISPVGVAVDGEGNVYIADIGNVSVLEMPLLPGGGYGPLTPIPTNTPMAEPVAIVVDGSGNIYIADSTGKQVLIEPPCGTSSLSPNGETVIGLTRSPTGVAVDANSNVYIGIQGSVVYEAQAGNYTTPFVITSPPSSALWHPTALALDGSGNLYVGGSSNFGPLVLMWNYATPPTVNFATATSLGRTDTKDGPQNFTLFNAGNATLTFLTPGSNTDAEITDSTGSFILDSSTTCPEITAGGVATGSTLLNLPANNTCLYAVDFAPTSNGPIAGTLTLTDSNLNVATPPGTVQTINLSGTGMTILLSPSSGTSTALAAGTIGTFFSQNFTASNGTAPYTFATSLGTLPPGLTLSGAGVLSGTPTTAGPYSFTVIATDTYSNTGIQAYTLTVNQAAATVTLGSLSQAYTGSPLSATATTVPTGLTVTFTYNGSPTAPTTAGSYAVVATINDPNYTGTASGTLIIGLTTPVITWPMPASIPAGTALTSAQLNASTGGVAGTYTYTPLAGTIPAVGTDTLSVSFVPTDTADYNTPAPRTVQQVVVAPPVLTMAFAPAQIALNGVTTLTFQITNPAANTVALSGISLIDNLPAGLVVAAANGLTSTCGGTPTAVPGAQSISLTGGSIPTGSSCTLSANVTALVSSGFTNTANPVTASNGGAGNAAYASLMVTSGVTFAPSSLTFSGQVVNSPSAPQIITLTNNYANILTVVGIEAAGDFAETNTCTTIAQGANCTISVTYTPTGTGASNGSIIVSDSEGTQVVLLSGTGIAPGVRLSPASLVFGSQTVGTISGSQTVTLTDNGTSDLTISSVTASGDFAETDTCASNSIQANGTCGITVTFNPTATGTRTGSITIIDSVGTHAIGLTGTANAPGVGLSLSNLTFGSETVNTPSAADNVTLTNTGDSNLTITSVTAAGDFGETDNCVSLGTLAPLATCTIGVTFTPAATGARSGTVTIVDSVGSHVITLAGTGIAPGVELSPTSVSFGSQTVGTASTSQAVTLTNNGGSNLNITGVSASGDFGETDNCTSGSPIASSGTCTITITFTPAATGTRTGSVIITDGAGTQVVAMTGTGAAPGASLSPATLSFGSVTVGSSAPLTSNVQLPLGTSGSLTVTGVTISGDYTAVNNCSSSIVAGGSCGLAVTFTPAAAGSRTGTALVGYTVGADTGQLVLALNGTGAAPGAHLSTTSLSFGNETVGFSSTALPVVLTNNGTSSLTVSGISASGDFTLSDTCGTLAAGGGSCTIDVTFTPTATGARAGALNIVDGVGTQVVNLSGTGMGASISLTPSAVTFGSQTVGTTSAATPVTLNNTGAGNVVVSGLTASGDFAISGSTCTSVASGSYCTISITFTPSAIGTRTGSITIVDSEGTHVVPVSGAGTAPGVSLSYSSLSFGSQTVGTTSGAQTVGLQNTGNSPLTVSSFSTSGNFAVISSNCSTLPATAAAGASCLFQVTFTPGTTGTLTGSLIINDSVGTHVVSLSGTGSAPGVNLSPGTLSFGSVPVGTTSQQTASVTLDIATSSTLSVTGVSISGDYTYVNSCSGPVSPGGSCSVSITFAPVAIGTRTGTALIAYTSATTTGELVLALTGLGTAPGVTLTPSSYTFGSTVVGSSSAPYAVTLQNSGTSGLTGLTLTPIGDFSETNDCGTTAASGATCTINVTFAPKATGSRTGSVQVSSNAGTQILSLLGTGTAAGVSLAPSSINFGNEVVSTTSAATLTTLTNNGTATLTVSSVTASGDFASTSTGCGSVAGSNGTCAIHTSFTPTAIGTRTGTVTIVDSVGTHTVALSGTGLAPSTGFSSTLVDFGSYTIGTVSSVKTVTLTNTGTSSLTVSSYTTSGDYSVSVLSTDSCNSLPAALAVNGTCTFQILFSPTSLGTRLGNVTINDGQGTQVVSLTGVGLAPAVSLSPATLSFGSVTVGNTSQLTDNILLDGGATGSLTVSSAVISGNYTLVNNCTGSVSPGSGCSLSVTFAPTAATATNASTGTVVIGYTIGTTPGQLVLQLEGTGTEHGVSFTSAGSSVSTLAFGSQSVNTVSAAQTVTLTNSGQSNLLNLAIAATGDFAQTTTCGSGLSVGGSCTLSVTFTPVASGIRAGAIIVTDNAGSQTLALSGTGNAPGVSLSPTSTLNFYNQSVYTTSGSQTVTVTNNGNSALTFTSILAAGDYSETDTCGLNGGSVASGEGSIAPLGTCTVTVRFTPTATGTRNGTVALFSNASTQAIVMTGSGTVSLTPLSATELYFGSQDVGTASASQSVILTNNSGSDFTVNCSITGDFTITAGSCPAAVDVPNGGNLTVSVAFQPTAQGTRGGMLSISSATATWNVALSGTGMDPAVDLTPASLNFGTVLTGSNSVLQNVRVTNTGSGNLVLSSVATTAEFSVSSADCPTISATVAIGGYCTFSVVFSPTEAGTILGSLTLTDNEGTGTQTAGLTGYGELPGVTVSNPVLTFGSQTIGTSSAVQTSTLTNSGIGPLTVTSINATGDYSVTSVSCPTVPTTLAVGASCDLNVTFTPTYTGTRNGEVDVEDNAGTQTVALTGPGVVPGASLSSSLLSFGSVIVGQNAQLITNVMLDSLTDSPLKITSIVIDGPYTQSNSCTALNQTISPGSSCPISVTFTPVATGTGTGLALINYTVGTIPGQLSLALTGMGTAPGMTLLPSSLNFSSQVINTTSSVETFTLTNSGTSGLTITGVNGVVAVGDFAQTNNCASVPAGNSCTISVTFTPTAADTPTASTQRTGSVTITSGSGAQIVEPLTGTATAPGVSFSPTSLSFAGQAVNSTSASQTVTLTNTGTSTLTVHSVTSTGDFSETNTCSTVAPLSTCTFTVYFVPKATGSRTGTINVVDDAGTNTTTTTQFITLSGTGTSASVSLSPSSVNFGNQTVGTNSSTQPVTITNGGGASLTGLTLAASGDYSVSAGTCGATINSGANCTMQITFSPAMLAARPGLITVSDSAGVQLITLTGVGTAPGVTLAPSTLAFGSVALGSNSQLVVNMSLDAASADPMTVNSISVDGDFSVVNACTSSVSAGGQCSFTVTFEPTTTGARTGSAVINYTVGSSTQVLIVALTGTGDSPGVTLAPSSVSFGSQVVNTTSGVTLVTLTNNGNSGLTGPGALPAPVITYTGDFFESNNCSGGISPAGSCTISLTFTPTATGTRSGTITISDNLGVQTVTLTGTGNAPGVTLAPSTYGFGSIVVGSSSGTQSFTLTNSGTSNLTIASISAAGDFSQTDNCVSPLASLASCTIQATFSPTTTGIRNGTVTIVDGAGTHVATLNGTGIAPGVSLTASSLTFGNQVINTTSTSQSVTLTNSGSSPLTITSVTPATGDFAQASGCVSGGPLAINGNCTITVTFTPTAAGSRTGSVTITDATGLQYVIALGGTGTAPGVSLTPSTLSFGSVVINTPSATQTVTLKNTGTSNLTIAAIAATGDYSETNPCPASLAANAQCVITVTFTPTTAGAENGTLTITDGAGTHFVALSGTGTAPGVTLSGPTLVGSTLTYGSQTVGTTSALQTVTLTNSGTSPLTVSSFTSGGDFAVVSPDCTSLPIILPVSGTCTLQITFSPAAAGGRSGSVVIAGSVGTQVIALTGTGAAPGASLSPANLTFGNVTVGTSSQLSASILLSAATSSGLQVTGTSISGDYTLVSGCSALVAPGSSCSVNVTFTPTTTGVRSGTALINYTVGTDSGVLVLALAGTGTAVGLSPSTLSFGSQVDSTTSAAQIITVTNNGISALSMGAIAANGDFAETNTCGASLAAYGSGGDSCTVTVTFTPTTTGVRNGAITVADSEGLQTVALSGTGNAPGVSLTPTTYSFGSVVVGSSSGTESITLTNSGSSNLTIASINAAGDFSQTNNCVSPIASLASCTIQATFTPKTTGTRNGTVTLVDGAGTHVVTLSGIGDAPGVSLTASSLTFGTQVITTTSASQTVTLTNNGTSSLTIASVTPATGDFAQTSGCVTASPMAINATCTVIVTFTPTATGARTGSVTLTDSSGTQHVIALTGTGTAPGVSLTPSTLAFGSVVINTPSATQTVTLKNSGTSNLTVGTIAATGDYSETNTCISPLAANTTCVITVTFTPVASGTRNGALTITDGAGTQFAAFGGTGTAPGVTLTGATLVGSTLTYGSQTVGTTSAVQTVTLTNSGTSPLTVNSFTSGGDFAVTSSTCASLPTVLAVSGTCTLQITFSPAAAGGRTGSVVIADSVGNQVIALTATGAAPGASLSPANLTFGSVAVGSTSQLSASVLLSAATSSGLQVTSTSIDGDYTLTNTCSTLVAPGSSCGLTVTFAPTTTGARTGAALVNYTVGTDTGVLVLAINGTGTAPGVNLSAANLSFGNESVGSTTAAQTVTLTNNGTSSLTISSIAASSEFAETNTCGGSLAASAHCTITVTFTPAATGLRNGAVTISTNAGLWQVVTSGNGTNPGGLTSESNLQFGSQVIGIPSGPQSFTFTNTGTSALTVSSVTATGDFGQTNNCSTLAAGAYCTITVIFTPTVEGTRVGSVTINNSVSSNLVALGGVGYSFTGGLSSGTLTFGSQTVGTASSTQSVTLTNLDSSTLSVIGISATGDFTVSSPNCATLPASLAPSSVCTLQVVFSPTAIGIRTGTVTVTDGDGTETIALTGTGASPGVTLAPPNLNFGSVTVGSSAQLTANVDLDPSSDSPMQVTGVSISGDFIVASGCSSAVSAGGSCGLSITFAPTAPGIRTGTAVINYTVGTGSGQLVLALSGNGTAPGVSLTPSFQAFGSQVVGIASPSQSIVLTNTGTSSLAITSLNTTGDFAETDNCVSPIATGNFCTINVTFTPTATGVRNGTVTIADGAGTQVAALTGTGNAPGVGLSASLISFGSQTVGTSSAAQSATLTNLGGSTLTVTGITASGDFSVSSPDCPTLPATVAVNAVCTLQVIFSPAAIGTRTGTITVTDSNGTYTIALVGTGASPNVTLAPPNLNFGSVTVGNGSQLTANVNLDPSSSAPMQVTAVSISGDFSVVSGCASPVSAGSSCGLSITLAPTAPGIRTGTAVISYTVGTGSGQLVLALSGNGTAPGVSLAPSTLSFGSQVVGIVSPSQSTVLTDNGTSDLAIASINAAGDFAESDNCASPITSGNSCTINVTFAPTATGTRNGTVTIVDGAGTHVATLTGTGNAPGVSLSPSTMAFGSQVVGVSSAAQTVWVGNTGTSPLTVSGIAAAGDFAQTNNCNSVAPGASCAIQVIFTPAAPGTRNGTITIIDNAGTHVVALSGTGNTPGVNLTPSTVTFGSQVVGVPSVTQTVTLGNTGTSPLSVSSVTATGDFAQTNNCITVAAGSSCTINVTFTPATTGVRGGTVTIVDGAGTQVATLIGTGNAPGVSLAPSTLIFGSEVVGVASAVQMVSVSNTGTSPLTVSSVTAAGDFVQTNNCNTVAAGASCSIQVTFSPTATGTRNGSITLIDSVGTQVVTLIGAGNAPGVNLSVSQIGFGSQTVGTGSATQSATLTNVGGSDLTVMSLTASGDFSVSSLDCPTLPTTVAVNALCTLQVIFNPVTTGVRTGTVTITDSNGTQTIALSGTGTAPGVTLAPPNLNFGSVTLGSSAQLTANVNLDALTGGSLMVTAVTVSGDFSLVNQCTTPIDPGDECGLSVTFVPAALGTRTGTAVVNYTVGSGSGQLILALSGNGTSAGLALVPSTLDFGSQLVDTSSTSQTVMVSNTSANAVTVNSVSVSGDFTLATGSTQAGMIRNIGTRSDAANATVRSYDVSPASTCATIAPGSNCTIQTLFTPSAMGTRNGTMVLTTSSGLLNVALAGTANIPGVDLNPSTLSFGSQAVTTTSTSQTVTVTNTGTSPLTLSSVTAAGDFSQINNCATVAPGASCAIQSVFAPAATGTRNGTLTLVDNDGTHVVALTGMGNAPGIALQPSALVFAGEPVGSISGAQTVTVSNIGSSPLAVSSVSAAGDFAETNNCGTVPSGSSCAIQVTFNPASSGTRNGIVVLVDSAGTHIVALTGSGLQVSLGYSPLSLTFPLTSVSKTGPTQTLNLTNYGTTALTIGSIVASAEFAQTNTCSAPLSPGSSCTVTVSFTPLAFGPRNGSLAVTSNGQGSPQQIPLIGTGADYSLAMSIGSSPTAQVAPGGTAIYQISASALNYQGLVTLSCAGAPAGSTCAVTPLSVNMTGTNLTPVTVTVTTTAAAIQTTGLPTPNGLHMPLWLWLVGAAGIFVMPWRRDTWQRYGARVMVLLMALALVLPVIGCGTSSSSSNSTNSGGSVTPAGTYQLMLVGTGSDGVQHNLQLTMQVN
jgi:hypothetical protein